MEAVSDSGGGIRPGSANNEKLQVVWREFYEGREAPPLNSMDAVRRFADNTRM